MDAIELLLGRTSALKLQGPGPSQADLDVIFTGALRAPDHGRRRPWRFIVIEEDKRARFGELMADLLRRQKIDATPEALEQERRKALRAPVIIVSAARIKRDDSIPEVEQMLSAGAATQNVMLAAEALGYGAMWKTGAPAYDDRVKQALGLESGDAIVGFIYVGKRLGGSSPAPRPTPADLVTVWQG